MAYSFSSPQDLCHDRTISWVSSLYDERNNFKKLKKTENVSELIDSCISSNSNSRWITRADSISNFSSILELQFMDQTRVLKLRYPKSEEVGGDIIHGGRLSEEETEEGNEDGMKLVHQLISCAEAVACRDKSHASLLLSELHSNALVFGSSFQRVASCFVQGLEDRLAMIQPLGKVGYIAPKMKIMDVDSEKKEEALRLVYENCPHIQFGHFVANYSILEALEGESSVHVVDLGMTLGLSRGHQWLGLMQGLIDRVGPPPRLRITAVGLSTNKFHNIGMELEACALGLGLDIEFSIVESNLETLNPKDIRVCPGELLVVNSILQLHFIVKESRRELKAVLQTIHELRPKVLVLVEQDSSHNGPFFLGRFMEALHYYSAIFDSLDAMLPKYNTKRAKMEQFYFAEEIKNIVSCEGPERVERHERVDQWRRWLSRAGFRPKPLKTVARAREWLSGITACEGYTIVEERGCLVLGWKYKPIVAASCWKC